MASEELFCGFCSASIKRGKFCNRAHYQEWWRENVQARAGEKGRGRLAELRERGEDPAHGGAAAESRGRKISESNRLKPRKEREEWRPVVGYEGLYSVSNLGRVRSEERTIPTVHGSVRVQPARIRRPVRSASRGNAYFYVILTDGAGKRENFRISRLVAVAFLGPRPLGTVLQYLDGDANNARAANLRYAPQGRREQEARKRRQQRGARRARVDRLIAEGRLSQTEIAKHVGLSKSTISKIKKGER